MAQEAVKNLTGLNGGKLIDGNSGVHTGEWNAVQFTQDSMIQSYKGNINTTDVSMVGLGMPGGLVLFGITTEIELSAGSAILYKR